jgi:archaellum component FlaC
MEKEIKMLDNIYSSIMSKLDDKKSNKLYRISQVQEVLSQIDDLQYNLENL